MRNYAKLLAVLSVAATFPFMVLAQTLPSRQSPIPKTTDGVPHIQIGVQPVPELSAALLKHVEALPGVDLGPTRVSLPGAVGFQLDAEMVLARPEVIVGGREFAHLHPDGSLHASLEPEMARAAIEAGWAVAHPWADQREGWEGFVMIFTPATQAELKVVVQLVQNSYSFVTGKIISDDQ